MHFFWKSSRDALSRFSHYLRSPKNAFSLLETKKRECKNLVSSVRALFLNVWTAHGVEGGSCCSAFNTLTVIMQTRDGFPANGDNTSHIATE